MTDAERLTHLNRVHHVLFKIAGTKGLPVNVLTASENVDDAVSRCLKLAAQVGPTFGIQVPTNTWIKELVEDVQDVP